MSLNRLGTPFAILLAWLLLTPIFVHAADNEGTDKAEQTKELIETPGKTNTPADNTTSARPFLSKWLHMLDSGDNDIEKESSVLAYGPQVPGDIVKSLNTAGGNKGALAIVWILLKSGISIAVGLLAIFLLKKTIQARLTSLEQLAPPDGEGFSKLAAGILRSLPELVTLLVLAISSTLSFLLIAGNTSTEGRILYQGILGIVLVFMSFRILSTIIFAPEDKNIRPFPISDSLVNPLHQTFSIGLSILASALLFIRCFRELGAQPQTISWLSIILGSVILALIAYLILYLRKPVTEYLQSGLEQDGSSWLKQNMAQFWSFPALLYVAVVWFIWVGQESTGTGVRNGSFVISVLIVPIYFSLSYFGRVLIESVIDSLGIGKVEETDELISIDAQESTTDDIAGKATSIFRTILVAVLLVWVLNLWEYNFPYATHAMKALFESLVAVGLALLCWSYATKLIEKKIADATPEVKEKDKDNDDEFGGAVPRGRSHTLLPMLRKAIATTLIVMVTLIAVSALGINIGPLLAGAGVLGLAVGFGAQKLVSDILSGFFFLLDDSFRVGEYIQAGSIRGTVEGITLRNVLLRHHLGMLQIVPHSDLGAVTNYMRGGMVIKFPLEFPYDTDIEKVRKIIKKVGQAMLLDEELGDGFLQPIKSQGVYGIANSVMVIRAKFTAKPGQQFVIKREALRLITEALNAKGIYYAHRKVIVDFPHEGPQNNLNEQTRQKALQAGAAAVMEQEAEELVELKKEST
jgi:small-conductance mechanosensitive channel